MQAEDGGKRILFLTLFTLLLVACQTRSVTPEIRTTPVVEATATLAFTPAEVATPTVTSHLIRPSTIAGSWYPSDPDELVDMVDGFLSVVNPVDGEPLAIIVPHAGYIYSGPIAAYGFKQMDGVEYDVAVIIASDHRRPISNPISVWAEGGFETPLGIVHVDTELAASLIAADPRIVSEPATHEGEHAIEIELPFLQRVCPNCKFVPVLMGADDQGTIDVLVEALIPLISGKRTIIIASSDLSHYPSFEDALVVDGATLSAIETGDPDHVRDTMATSMTIGYPNLVTSACGEAPILVAMRVSQGLGADTITILNYANSGHSPFGNQEQVVGYGAVMFWHYQPPALSLDQQEELLTLARSTITEYLKTDHLSEYWSEDPILTRRSGVFVTLKQQGQLRGCTGNLRSNLPLIRAVQEMAVSAATSDPRFPQLTLEELEQVSIEISILSPLKRITEFEQIEVGTHGLVIIHAGQRGVLLPQVPVEQGWDREVFLENLCLKAGLPPDCWTEKPTLYTFTALVFDEE